ncbi:Uncharacterised protein [Mycobacterium tuberculosis]|nr:Uncharacterised protein [Mycobacterium tuberculosis]CKU48562.1 Uncharacterised protein [Mycobacterium tuberculosis]
MVEFLLTNPGRQPGRLRKPIDKAVGAGRQHTHCRALIARRAQTADHSAHRAGRVAIEFGVGDAGLLEIKDVEEVLPKPAAERLRRRHLRPGQRGDAQRGNGGDSVSVQQWRVPHHHGTPVMTNPDRPLGTDII